MATNTSVYQFRKPADSDDVDPDLDLGDNWDKAEAALLDIVADVAPVADLFTNRNLVLTRAATQTVTGASTDTDVSFTVETTDNGYSVTVPATSVTLPADGMYSIHFITGWDGVGSGDRTRVKVLLNSNLIGYNGNAPIASNDDATTQQVVVPPRWYSSGDVIKIQFAATNASGALTNTTSATSIPPTLTIVRLF